MRGGTEAPLGSWSGTRAIRMKIQVGGNSRSASPGRSIRTFSMRARAPLFDTAPFDLVGRPTEGGAACEAWAVAPGGTIAMQASATFD